MSKKTSRNVTGGPFVPGEPNPTSGFSVETHLSEAARLLGPMLIHQGYDLGKERKTSTGLKVRELLSTRGGTPCCKDCLKPVEVVTALPEDRPAPTIVIEGLGEVALRVGDVYCANCAGEE